MSRKKDLIFVSVQLVLFCLFIFLPDFYALHFSKKLKLVGLIFSFAGLLVCLISIYQLRKSLTPFPSPVRNGTLVNTGLFKYVRHPIYSGILVCLTGYGLFSESVTRLMLVVMLLLLFYYKSRYEEKMLLSVYSGYHEYRKRTGRFFPYF
ncbi:isoprenylcysteine carboxylmethyltransferase family protein [Dyadobacter sp. 3J3]|uniref:methyltransferase family protein n=1 Tax=Dyadobacter sp. 3J3 TaxID=2606600 RepID=UPI0013572E5B|nr:isoprenylcysteine carboxylmethyltransferase family protein [Dyadobacter sp. 3J3]